MKGINGLIDIIFVWVRDTLMLHLFKKWLSILENGGAIRYARLQVSIMYL